MSPAVKETSSFRTHRYRDPLDLLWLETVRRVGFRVARSEDCYASTDGHGTMLLGTPGSLDPDDCLAQLVLHELCHAAVEGPGRGGEVDFGLCNETDRDLPREHACLRLQASLLRPFGLDRLLAPTTEHRSYYDALGDHPLGGSHPVQQAARRGRARIERAPFSPHVELALSRTRDIVALATEGAAPALADQELLLTLGAKTSQHLSGFFVGDPERTCGECAWFVSRGRAEKAGRCRKGGNVRIPSSTTSCERFEGALACRTCAACCRDAFDVVDLQPKETFVSHHPELVTRQEGRLMLCRSDGRCPALAGDASYTSGSYTCGVYETRPRSCASFAVAGSACLEARLRVGESW